MVVWQSSNPAGIYLLKDSNRNPRTRNEICSRLTIKNQNEARGVVLVFLILTLNTRLVAVFLLLTLNMKLPGGKYASAFDKVLFLKYLHYFNLIMAGFCNPHFGTALHITPCLHPNRSILKTCRISSSVNLYDIGKIYKLVHSFPEICWDQNLFC